jgi:DnaJ like chaperone protein
MTIWQRITGLASTLSSGEPSDQNGVIVADDGRGSVAFTMAVIALGAKMAKADGVVLPIEIDAFHQVFRTPPDQADRVRQVFELAQRDVAGFETYATQIHDQLGGDARKLRDVLECLFHIASADRALHPGEDAFLATVAQCFGFSESLYRHVRAQFVEDAGAPYDVLGLDPSATNEALKARHRKLVRENHPDLVAGRGLPAEAIEIATRKLAAINAAYETVSKERGL